MASKMRYLWLIAVYGLAVSGIVWFLIWESVLGASETSGDIALQTFLTPWILMAQMGLLSIIVILVIVHFFKWMWRQLMPSVPAVKRTAARQTVVDQSASAFSRSIGYYRL